LKPKLPAEEPPLQLPRLPIFGWDVFRGRKHSSLPCVLDHKNLVFTGSGRAAIALALTTIGIGRGDAVLVPTFHCPTMVSPIIANGAEPIFFPIDDHGTPRLDIVSGMKLDNVRAMLVAHYFGIPQPMALVRQLCDRLGIILIEDCAHAMFGEVDGRPVGKSGHYAIASLTKFLPVTDGGCLLVNVPTGSPSPPQRRSIRDEISSVANAIELGAAYEKLGFLSAPLNGFFTALKRVRSRTRSRVNRSPRDEVDQPLLDEATEITTLNSIKSRGASFWGRWIARAAHRERIVALRRRNYQHWLDEVATIPGTRAMQPFLPDSAAPYVFPLRVDNPEASYLAIRAAGVPIFRWDELWPGTPSISGDVGIDWATHVFQLGCHQDLSVDDVSRMAHHLRQILAGSGHPGRDSRQMGVASAT
jgi:perosamine synthetase